MIRNEPALDVKRRCGTLLGFAVPLSPDPTGDFEQAEPEAVLFAMFSGDDLIGCRLNGLPCAIELSPMDRIPTTL
jgi:hypothetical protein